MDQEDDIPEYGAGGHVSESGQIRFAPPEVPNGPYRAIYPDFEAVKQAKAERIEKRVADANDVGIYDGAPNNPVDQRRFIGDLYNAFNSIETEGEDAIIDKPTKNGKLSQAALKFQTGRYPPAAIEEVCWEIFDRARYAQMDVRLLEAFHEHKFEGTLIHSTFGARWTAIVGACARSKALCKMLLDAPYLDRFVSHPQAELKMKLNNKKINAQRDEQNEIGRSFLSKGLGKEEAAEAIAHLHPGDEDSFDRYAHLSPRKPSNGNAAGPTTPLAPVRIQPARSAVANSAKRKKISESEDEYDDDEDEYIDSAIRSSIKPNLRTRRATLKTPTRSNTTNSVMDKTPQSKRAKVPSTIASQRRIEDMAPLKSQAQSDAESDEIYRMAICRLLGLNPKHAQVMKYSLEDLRYYARAYNGEFEGSPWTHKDYPGFVGIEWTLKDANNNDYEHFSQIIKSLGPLAALRGDFVDGKLMKNKNKMFHPKSSADREALGATANAFGFHGGYPAPVSIKSHGSPDMLAENSTFSIPTRQPVSQMNAYQPLRQDYYQGQAAYGQVGSSYQSYNHNHTPQSYTNSPHNYISPTKSYEGDAFQQGSLGGQQTFAHAAYGSTNYGYNSQAAPILSDGLPYGSHNNNAYASSIRGQSTGYDASHTTQSSSYTSPQLGQGGGIFHHPHLTSLTSRHIDPQYPDPDDCSS
ncbi:predicted protein [Sclerotinia sclerotiorum 1980 UF-70]|uniref:Uncharacterized protein n=2 Tax=Sclerotinia sclerotiorum (strain ATCC 18683 / 1980 / Ss-1) TaxID=665079 RepID=A7F8X3_SCLS1|nr:predicted protein [Sclerotinia sclerotiorum 1980 UF-70]APA13155.1 hypothetical protein sscle_10g079250 [Sclerotinia sclerotiorum 1980 UF-70]EDN99194.1 predicted protein [Sclerotinia sclerotiorum 1980 UF-70]